MMATFGQVAKDGSIIWSVSLTNLSSGDLEYIGNGYFVNTKNTYYNIWKIDTKNKTAYEVKTLQGPANPLFLPTGITFTGRHLFIIRADDSISPTPNKFEIYLYGENSPIRSINFPDTNERNSLTFDGKHFYTFNRTQDRLEQWIYKKGSISEIRQFNLALTNTDAITVDKFHNIDSDNSDDTSVGRGFYGGRIGSPNWVQWDWDGKIRNLINTGTGLGAIMTDGKYLYAAI